MPMPTGNWEIPKYYGQWTVEDSQTDYLLTDQEGKESISIDSRFVDLKKTGLSTTLSIAYIACQRHPYIESLLTLTYKCSYIHFLYVLANHSDIFLSPQLSSTVLMELFV